MLILRKRNGPPRRIQYDSYVKFNGDICVKNNGSSWIGWQAINNANQKLLAAINEFKNEFKDIRIVRPALEELEAGLEHIVREIHFNLEQCEDNLDDALELASELEEDYRYSVLTAHLDESLFKEGFLNYLSENESLDEFIEDFETFILEKYSVIDGFGWKLYHVLIGAS